MTERRWMLSLYGPTLIEVAGAGAGTRNGVYKQVDDVNGRSAYQGFTVSDVFFIRWNNSPAQWEIGETLGAPDYYSAEDVMSPLAVVTWTASLGFAPAPAVTEYSTSTYNIQVYPANTASIKYTWERNLDQGQIFFRKKLSNELVFTNKTDVDRFWNRRMEGGCDPFYIRQEVLCGGRWKIAWVGLLAASNGRFDMDRCTYTVRPVPLDQYSCFLDGAKKKVNMLDVSAVTINAVIGIIPFPQFTRTYDGARLLKTVVEYMLSKMDCRLSGDVVSDFFEWNPVGDAPGYVAGQNYVTGANNELDLLYIMQTSDCIGTSPPSNPATKAEATLEDVLGWFCKMFNVFWDIDDDGNLRLEHWLYWNFPVGLDLTAIGGVSEALAFESNDPSYPRRENFSFGSNLDTTYWIDFTGKPIIYSGTCITGEDEKDISLPVITNIAWLVSADYDGGKAGVVIVATETNSPSPNRVIRVNGALSNGTTGTRPNATLSWANLHRDFYTWNRYMPFGNMNGEDVTFDDFLPNVVQPDVKVKLCCDVLKFEPTEKVRTNMGQLIGGIDAVVKKASWEDQSELLTLTLEYPLP
jgi:hypothetical protein